MASVVSWDELKPPGRSKVSNQTDWLHCFNTSATLPRYAAALYGLPTLPFEWSELDIVYPWLLVGLNQSCLFESARVYRRAIQGAFFVEC